MTLMVINTMLQVTTSAVHLHYRKLFLQKWLRGELTMEQLLWMKRQPWYRRAFKQVSTTTEKKNN